MAAEPDPSSWTSSAGVWLHLAVAASGLLLGVFVVVTVTIRPTDLCAFPTFDRAGCWGATSVAGAGLAGLLGLTASYQFGRSETPSLPLVAAADGSGILIGALFAARGYKSFQLVGFLLLGTSIAGLTLLAHPSARGDRAGETSGANNWRERIDPQRLMIGLHLLAAVAAVLGVLGLWEPVLTSPIRVCGLLVASLGPHLISYPCYSAAFLLHPLLAGLAGLGSAWALLQGRTVGKPSGFAVGVLSILTGFVLVPQGSPLPVISGLTLFGAGSGLLGLAFHPAFSATGNDR